MTPAGLEPVGQQMELAGLPVPEEIKRAAGGRAWAPLLPEERLQAELMEAPEAFKMRGLVVSTREAPAEHKPRQAAPTEAVETPEQMSPSRKDATRRPLFKTAL